MAFEVGKNKGGLEDKKEGEEEVCKTKF